MNAGEYRLQYHDDDAGWRDVVSARPASRAEIEPQLHARRANRWDRTSYRAVRVVEGGKPELLETSIFHLSSSRFEEAIANPASASDADLAWVDDQIMAARFEHIGCADTDAWSLSVACRLHEPILAEINRRSAKVETI